MQRDDGPSPFCSSPPHLVDRFADPVLLLAQASIPAPSSTRPRRPRSSVPTPSASSRRPRTRSPASASSSTRPPTGTRRRTGPTSRASHSASMARSSRRAGAARSPTTSPSTRTTSSSAPSTSRARRRRRLRSARSQRGGRRSPRPTSERVTTSSSRASAAASPSSRSSLLSQQVRCSSLFLSRSSSLARAALTDARRCDCRCQRLGDVVVAGQDQACAGARRKGRRQLQGRCVSSSARAHFTAFSDVTCFSHRLAR